MSGRRINVHQLDYDQTPVVGLALVGHYLKYIFTISPAIGGILRTSPGPNRAHTRRITYRTCLAVDGGRHIHASGHGVTDSGPYQYPAPMWPIPTRPISLML